MITRILVGPVQTTQKTRLRRALRRLGLERTKTVSRQSVRTYFLLTLDNQYSEWRTDLLLHGCLKLKAEEFLELL